MTNKRRTILNTILIAIAFFAFKADVNADSATVSRGETVKVTCKGGSNNYIENTGVARITKTEENGRQKVYTVLGVSAGKTTLVCSGIWKNVTITVKEPVIEKITKSKPSGMPYCSSIGNVSFSYVGESKQCWIPESDRAVNGTDYSCQGAGAISAYASENICTLTLTYDGDDARKQVGAISFTKSDGTISTNINSNISINFPNSSNNNNSNNNSSGNNGNWNNSGNNSNNSSNNGSSNNSNSGSNNNSSTWRNDGAQGQAQNTVNRTVGRMADGNGGSNEAGSGTSGNNYKSSEDYQNALVNNSTTSVDSKGVCRNFKICNSGSAHMVGGYKTFIYNVTPNCNENNGMNYVAMCIDPGRSSAPKCPSGGSYSSSGEITGDAARVLMNLYNGFISCGNSTECILKYQTAARIIEFQNPSIFGGTNGYNSGLKNVYEAYQGGKVDYNGASGIASAAMSGGSSGGTSAATTASFQQIGLANGTQVTYKLTVTNVEQSPTVTYTTPKNAQGFGGVYDAGSKTYTESVQVDTSNGECELEAKIDYNNPNDVNSVFIVRNGSGGYQRFLVFAVGSGKGDGNNSSLIAKTPINGDGVSCDGGDNCVGEDCDYQKQCNSKATLTCAPADGKNTSYNSVMVNEGDPYSSGVTNWEKCIINKMDNENNKYNILDQVEDDGTRARLIVGTGSELITEASYCSISCKERYDFKLPANQKDIKTGTYFSFDIANNNPAHAIVALKSERKCVTSVKKDANNPNGDIRVGEFERRVNNLKKQLIDLYNIKSYYKAMYDKINEVKYSYINGDGTSEGWNIGSLNDHSGHLGDSSDEYSVKNSYNNWKSNIESKDSIHRIDRRTSLSYSFQYDYKVLGATGDILNVSNATGYTNQPFSNSSATKNFSPTAYSNVYLIHGVDSSSTTSFNTGIEEDSFDEDYTYKVRERNYDILYGSEYREYDETGYVSANSTYQTRDTRESNMNNLLQRVKSIYEAAEATFKQVSVQIKIQGEGIKKCTNKLTETIGDTYKFNPSITWDYDQEDYLSMMSSKKLVIAGTEPSINSQPVYCNSSVAKAEEIFSCGSGYIEKTFNYLDESAGAANIVYYDVKRTGMISSYNCGDYCYYRSSTAFYTYPPDGIATAWKEEDPNTTIIENDGYVFPVAITSEHGQHYFSLKFEEIGQYFDDITGNSMGRIIGGNQGRGKQGTMSGDFRNEAVCTYTIEQIPDGVESCDDDYNEYCKSISSSADTTRCVMKMLEHEGNTCCSYAKKVLESGNYNEESTVRAYEKACYGPSSCVGFEVRTSWETVSSGISSYDRALVDNSGNLQFSVRTVSLNNLFPNNDAGKNWTQSYMSTVKNGDVTSVNGLSITGLIDLIQENGESIYGGDPDYSVILTPSCIKEIQSYNRTKEADGGLLDYDLDIEEDASYYIGSKADDSEFLSKLNGWGCTYRDPGKHTGIPN